MKDLKCKGCNKSTHNRTERCNSCRKMWRENMENIKSIDTNYIDSSPTFNNISTNCTKCGKQVEHINTVLNNWRCPHCNEHQSPSTVDHPKHYNAGKIEAIDVIEDWDLDFCLGNAVKYIARAGHKNSDKIEEDLQKAIWYIKRFIDRESGENNE